MIKDCLKKYYKIIILLFVNVMLFFSIIYINANTLDFSDEDKELIKLYNDKKLLMLTFDDGPNKYTKKLLDILDETGTKVTFFVLGEQIEKYPEIIKREYENGHLVCIHSYTHKFFTKISKEEIDEQIELTKDEIINLTGYTPRYIRVPYGIINNNVESILKEHNLENILWNVDSLDWKYKNKYNTVNHIKQNVKGNDIILMHDIFDPSIEAAKEIIDYYTKLGYRFITIDKFNYIKEIHKLLT